MAALLSLAGIIPTVLSFLSKIVWAVICIVLGIEIIKYGRKLAKKGMEKANIDEGVVQFADSFIKIAGYIVLALIILAHFGVQTTSFIAILGSAGIAIGLALQGSLSNFAGGLLILVLKPFKVGDYIDAGGMEGTVDNISLFSTTLKTVDNKNVIMPNGTLSNSNITNYSANEIRRVDLSVDVSYSSDLKKAQDIICGVLDADASVLKDPAYTVAVDKLGESGITILIRPWVNSADYWTVKWRTLENVCTKLQENGIEIPYPQLSVHVNK